MDLRRSQKGSDNRRLIRVTHDNVEGVDITGINKWGWEYLWVRYADAEDATAKALVKRPVAVYVEKVYDVGDFGLLGIGV